MTESQRTKAGRPILDSAGWPIHDAASSRHEWGVAKRLFASRSAFGLLAAIFCFALGSVSAHAQAQPSGVEATSLPLFQPAGVTYDSAGNMYIAELDENLIRKVDAHGIITTIAGTGEQGFGGDNGLATSAILDAPAGIALDASGNLYIADSHNHRIREINASTGIITTIAGTGVAGFSGDGGAATSAALNAPLGVAVDSSGNVYIADTDNHRVRKITGTTISTIVGNGDQDFEGDNILATATGLDSPSGIALDTARNLYIADMYNQRVRLVTAANGIITTFAGNGARAFSGDAGAATSASFARPRGIAVDSSGKVYIADSDNNRLRTVSGGTLSTLAGTGEQGFSGDTGAAAGAAFDAPRATGIFSSGGVTTTAVADAANSRVRTINSSTGVIETAAGIATGSSIASPTVSLALTGSATEVYGTGSIVATFSNSGKTATGTVTLLEGATPLGSGTLASNTATLTIPPLALGTHNLVATYPGDGANPAIASGIFVLTVTAAPGSGTTTVLTSSGNPAYLGTTVILTARVSSSASGTVSGTVNIFDGTAQIAGGTLDASGAYSFTTTTLITGTHALTAFYSASSTYSASSSTVLSETINPDPDFIFIPSPVTTDVTTSPGGTATFDLALTPSPTPYTNPIPITFSVSNLPPGATVTFSPSSVTLNSTTTNMTMTVKTPALAMLHRGAEVGGTIAFGLLLFPLLAWRRKSANSFTRLTATLLLLLGTATATTLLSGCASNNGFSYIMTVTATSTSVTGAPLTHMTKVQLTVK